MSRSGARSPSGPAASLYRGRVVFVLILMAIVAGCGVDRAQVRLCERVARVMEDESAFVEVLQALRHLRLDDAVILDYRVTAASGEAASHWISCRFTGGSLAPRALVGVTTSREGTLAPIRVALLQIWLRLADRGPPPADEQSSAPGPPSDLPCTTTRKRHPLEFRVCLDRVRWSPVSSAVSTE